MGIQQPPAGFLKNIEKKKIRKRSEIYLVSKQTYIARRTGTKKYIYLTKQVIKKEKIGKKLVPEGL